MKTWSNRLPACLAVFTLLNIPVFAEIKTEQQIIGPLVEDAGRTSVATYTISPRGQHLATITHKGSRLVVIIDGVPGPKCDEVLVPGNYIDPRPYQVMDVNEVPRNLPVTFSKDGKRFAYIVRQSQEWVLMADNKEVLRIPAEGTATADLHLEFTGDDGQHLLFSHAVHGGYELWVDGQKWPGLYASGGGGSAGTVDPVISSDGKHIAYVGQIARDKQALILDGADAGYMGDHLRFTADSQHLICINHSPKGDALLMDGKSQFTATQIIDYFLAPVGNGMIVELVHRNADASIGYFLMANGKPVDASLSPNVITSVIFSPDGKHYAAICGGAPRQFVVSDGKKGQEYQSIYSSMLGANSFAFSPDSSKLAYLASAAGKEYVVVNDDESDGYDNMSFIFSGDGKHVVYSGYAAGNSHLFLDGKPLKAHTAAAAAVAFRPDNAHFAYEDKDGVYFDGQPAGITSSLGSDHYTFLFSPDSQHAVTFGARISDQKYGLFVDGQLVCPFDGSHFPRFCAFTPDSQHLYWFIIEPAAGANAGPGKYEWVTYLDGKAVARCEDNTTASGMLYQDYMRAKGGITQLGRTPAAWNVGPDGMVTFIGLDDEGVKRFTITPSSETSVATLLAGVGKPGTTGTQPAAPATSPKPAAVATPAPAARPVMATPAASAGNIVTNQPKPVAQTMVITNKVAVEINDAVDKSKAAADAFKHLFGK